MRWTLPDVWELPTHYYDFIVDEITAAQERA